MREKLVVAHIPHRRLSYFEKCENMQKKRKSQTCQRDKTRLKTVERNVIEGEGDNRENVTADDQENEGDENCQMKISGTMDEERQQIKRDINS